MACNAPSFVAGVTAAHSVCSHWRGEVRGREHGKGGRCGGQSVRWGGLLHQASVTHRHV